MKTENQINLSDIIKDRKILPIEIKKTIINNIFFNCLLFIIILIIVLIINISFKKLTIIDFDNYIDVIQIFCAIISVTFLEVAFRKNSGKIGIYGIELLFFSICVLFVPYMYISKSNIYYLKNLSLFFFIYYIIKSIGTLFYIRYNYLKNNLSDVKEIVKETKESYIDEESIKTLKKNKKIINKKTEEK